MSPIARQAGDLQPTLDKDCCLILLIAQTKEKQAISYSETPKHKLFMQNNFLCDKYFPSKRSICSYKAISGST